MGKNSIRGKRHILDADSLFYFSMFLVWECKFDLAKVGGVARRADTKNPIGGSSFFFASYPEGWKNEPEIKSPMAVEVCLILGWLVR